MPTLWARAATGTVMVTGSDRQRRITTASPRRTRTPHSPGLGAHSQADPATRRRYSAEDSGGSGRAACAPAVARPRPGGAERHAFLGPRSRPRPVRPSPVRAFPPFPLPFPRPRDARHAMVRRVLRAGNITCPCSPGLGTPGAACSGGCSGPGTSHAPAPARVPPARNSPDPDLVPMARRTRAGVADPRTPGAA